MNEYNLGGIGSNVELGKQGPQIVGSDSAQISLTDSNANVTVATIADGVDASHAVTKAQLDAASLAKATTVTTTVSYNSGNVSLGNITANSVVFSVAVEKGAGNWTGADSNTTITVGDDANPSRLFSGFDLTAQVIDETDTVYTTSTELKIYVTQGGASSGTAKVTVLHTGIIE